MHRNKILLSTGSFPWLNMSQTGRIAKATGLSGIEFVPTRACMNELQKVINSDGIKSIKSKFSSVLSIHHSWRLDTRNDIAYGITKNESAFYNIIRLIFFPSTNKVRKSLSHASQALHVPLTVHQVTNDWIYDDSGKEFRNDISLEMLNTQMTKVEIREWLKKTSHFLVLDTRDDQSLMWAKSHGFDSWEFFWEWITLQKIKGLQVTLIGTRGMDSILKKKPILAEKQLLWLHQKKWQGCVTLEINPASLFVASRGNVIHGLKSIRMFIEQTLIYGKKWST